VPYDIAVVGAGDIHCSGMRSVPLSTVKQSSFQMGEGAATFQNQSVEPVLNGPYRFH